MDTTGARAKAWCLLEHTEASLSLSLSLSLYPSLSSRLFIFIYLCNVEPKSGRVLRPWDLGAAHTTTHVTGTTAKAVRPAG